MKKILSYILILILGISFMWAGLVNTGNDNNVTYNNYNNTSQNQSYKSPIILKENVKCIFGNSTKKQDCYSDSNVGCSGIGTCGVVIKGEKGKTLTWKSSCGGYAYTTIDGKNKYAEFKCQDVISNNSKINITLNNCKQLNENQCKAQINCTPEYKKVKGKKGYKNVFKICNNKINKVLTNNSNSNNSISGIGFGGIAKIKNDSKINITLNNCKQLNENKCKEQISCTPEYKKVQGKKGFKNEFSTCNILSCKQLNENKCLNQDKCTPEYKKVNAKKGFKNEFLTCNTLGCKQLNENKCKEQISCTPEYKKVQGKKGFRHEFTICKNN